MRNITAFFNIQIWTFCYLGRFVIGCILTSLGIFLPRVFYSLGGFVALGLGHFVVLGVSFWAFCSLAVLFLGIGRFEIRGVFFGRFVTWGDLLFGIFYPVLIK